MIILFLQILKFQKIRFRMSSVKERIDKLVKEKKVFVVSKSSCPFCITAKVKWFKFLKFLWVQLANFRGSYNSNWKCTNLQLTHLFIVKLSLILCRIILVELWPMTCKVIVFLKVILAGWNLKKIPFLVISRLRLFKKSSKLNAKIG